MSPTGTYLRTNRPCPAPISGAFFDESYKALRMAMRPRNRLSTEQRRALQLLASSPCGATEEVLVLAHGFSCDMLAGLVIAGLAALVTERADGQKVKVVRMRITEAGRMALER